MFGKNMMRRSKLQTGKNDDELPIREVGKYGLAFAIAISTVAIVFGQDEATASKGLDGRQAKCMQQYSGAGAQPHDAYSRAEAERIRDVPLDQDMIPVGGVDLPGWAEACQYDPERPDLLVGEYRDRSVRYVGRFQLRVEDGRAVPDDALDAYYGSHFVSGTGLIMYPNDPERPRVPRVIAVPIDEGG